MELNKNDPDTNRHYLLGKLAGEDLETFEKRILTDDNAFEELLAAEDNLVDEYVKEDLTSDERAVFEKKFLTTFERQRDVHFARVFHKFLKQKAARRSPWPLTPNQAWIVRTAAAVLVISFLAVLVYQFTRPSPRVSTLSLIASVITRGGEGPQVPRKNLHEFDVLRISLKLPDGFPPATNYRAELQPESSATKTVKVIETDSQSVTVEVPAAELTPGLYSVKIYAIDAGGTEKRVPGAYRFEVE